MATPSHSEAGSPPRSRISTAELAGALHQLDEAHRRFRQATAKELGLFSSDLAAFAIITDTPGISPKDLGHDLGLSSGAITALVDRLEKRGLAGRTADPTDRRALHLRLSSEGEDVLTDIRKRYRATLEAAGAARFTQPDLEYLRHITTHLNNAAITPGNVNTPNEQRS